MTFVTLTLASGVPITLNLGRVEAIVPVGGGARIHVTGDGDAAYLVLESHDHIISQIGWSDMTCWNWRALEVQP